MLILTVVSTTTGEGSMRRTFLSLLVVLLILIAPQGQANVVGSEVQNFNPITSGLDFVTVQSSETLRPGVVNFGLFFNYAINSLPNYRDVTTQDRTNFQDTLLSSDINIGVGLMRGWDVGISLPSSLSSSVDSDVAGAEFEQTGLNEIRANTKVRFWGDNSEGLGMVASVNVNQIENNAFAGDGAGPTFNLELVGDTTVGKVALGGNIGFRARNSGTQLANIPVEPFGNQFILSVAASYLLTEQDTKLIGEIYSSFPAEDSDFTTDRELSSSELLVGVKTDITRDWAFHAGAGTEIYHGSMSPDWRVYTGVNYTVGPLWAKEKRVIVRKKVHKRYYIDEENPYDHEPQDEEVFVAKDVLFAFDSDKINRAFIQPLLDLGAYLRRPPGFCRLIIEGHTDSIGSAAYNLDLSRRRSITVKKVLAQEVGIPVHKIKAVGYGEAYPIADNGNYQGRSINRRVEFKIQRGKKCKQSVNPKDGLKVRTFKRKKRRKKEENR